MRASDPKTRHPVTFASFIRYQMKTFYNESTKHYIAARQAFALGLINGPTLLIYSNADPLSTREINATVVREFKEKNLMVNFQFIRFKQLVAIELFLAFQDGRFFLVTKIAEPVITG